MFVCFSWAVSTIMTRQNLIPSKNATDTMIHALIPMWDMCNHEEGVVSKKMLHLTWYHKKHLPVYSVFRLFFIFPKFPGYLIYGNAGLIADGPKTVTLADGPAKRHDRPLLLVGICLGTIYTGQLTSDAPNKWYSTTFVKN